MNRVNCVDSEKKSKKMVEWRAGGIQVCERSPSCRSVREDSSKQHLHRMSISACTSRIIGNDIRNSGMVMVKEGFFLLN